MNYKLREGLVRRDIAGLYFIIDVHDKHFYRNKQVICVNEIAYAIIGNMQSSETFSVESLRNGLLPLLSDQSSVSPDRIDADVLSFITLLKEKGWVLEC